MILSYMTHWSRSNAFGKCNSHNFTILYVYIFLIGFAIYVHQYLLYVLSRRQQPLSRLLFLFFFLLFQYFGLFPLYFLDKFWNLAVVLYAECEWSTTVDKRVTAAFNWFPTVWISISKKALGTQLYGIPRTPSFFIFWKKEIKRRDGLSYKNVMIA